MKLAVEPISRLAAYSKRHGIRATFERAGLFLRRLSSSRMVLFYLDFAGHEALAGSERPPDFPENLSVEVKLSPEEIAPQDWERILNYWNPSFCRRHYPERFQQGAALWLIRSNGELAGHGWTIAGKTVEPHYYPLGENDVHLFDFLVFPEFRGRNINPHLLGFILHRLALERRAKAYIEVREWNVPQLKSLSKTPFKLLGAARKASLLGLTFVQWTSKPVAGFPEMAEGSPSQQHPIQIFSAK